MDGKYFVTVFYAVKYKGQFCTTQIYSNERSRRFVQSTESFRAQTFSAFYLSCYIFHLLKHSFTFYTILWPIYMKRDLTYFRLIKIGRLNKMKINK